jgi:hypothetical protein
MDCSNQSERIIIDECKFNINRFYFSVSFQVCENISPLIGISLLLKQIQNHDGEQKDVSFFIYLLFDLFFCYVFLPNRWNKLIYHLGYFSWKIPRIPLRGIFVFSHILKIPFRLVELLSFCCFHITLQWVFLYYFTLEMFFSSVIFFHIPQIYFYYHIIIFMCSLKILLYVVESIINVINFYV